jgi:hypothetical protein
MNNLWAGLANWVGRQRDRRALECIALGLTVQRLMLDELLEHDHRLQTRPRSSPPDRRVGPKRILNGNTATRRQDLGRYTPAARAI